MKQLENESISLVEFLVYLRKLAQDGIKKDSKDLSLFSIGQECSHAIGRLTDWQEDDIYVPKQSNGILVASKIDII